MENKPAVQKPREISAVIIPKPKASERTTVTLMPDYSTLLQRVEVLELENKELKKENESLKKDIESLKSKKRNK